MSIFLVRQPLSSAADFVIMNDIFSFTKPREMLVGTPTPAVPVASCVPATITYPTTCGVAATIVPTAPALAYQPPQPCSVVGAVAVSAAVPRTLVTFLAPIPETEVVQEVVQLPKNDIVVPPENGIPTTTSYTTSVPSASAPAQPADSVTKSVVRFISECNVLRSVCVCVRFENFVCAAIIGVSSVSDELSSRITTECDGWNWAKRV